MHLDGAAVRAACGPARAAAAITAALAGGLDPAADPARSVLDLRAGQLLLMPGELPAGAGGRGSVGVKVVTVAAAGRPRIQGSYLLFDGRTLALRAVLDGPALTALRTPAVSVAAVRGRLAAGPAALRVVVFGAGPQATGHVAALAAARPLAAVRYVVRTPGRPPAGPGDTAVLRAGSAAADDALAAADVVVCATTAGTPVLRSDRLREDAVVIAVGSHEPDRRELDGALMHRAVVVVEDVRTALREAGDVVLAVAEGALSPAELVPMAEVVRGDRALPADRPVVFKSVGMSWQDLVVADAVLAAHPAGA